ncbi:MAG: BNR-4 repeat-containing protein [Bacteroidetes bacterium]|nr:BNR-4 repeat-containing protein [Bacteroidota bacterium]
MKKILLIVFLFFWLTLAKEALANISCNRCSTVNGCQWVSFTNQSGQCDVPDPGVTVIRTTNCGCPSIPGGNNDLCNTCTVDTQYIYTHPFAYNTVAYHGRMKGQISAGVYDPISNKTFMVYPSGTTADGLHEASPYIVYYDHRTRAWSPEKKIWTSQQYDNHNYPQLIIDRNGYLHIFHTQHGTSIIHAVSQNPRDISTWNTSTLPNVPSATYGAAFKANNGDIYLIFRSGISGPPNPWHEPEKYLKSTDNGQTWAQYTLIDPGINSDGYNTIYTKALVYSSNPEGLHIVFGDHKDHNSYFNRHYYFFLNFSNNHVYSASGQDLGTELTRNEYRQCCEIFRYNQDMHYETYGSTPIVIAIDNNNKPMVFYGKYQVNYQPYHFDLWWARWNGTSWNQQHISSVGIIASIHDALYKSDNNIDLLLRVREGSNSPTYLYYWNGSAWNRDQTVFPQPINYSGPITNANPEISGIFISHSGYSPWYRPLPTGTFHSAGKVNLNIPSQCPTSDYQNYTWSGNSYFQYPITQPCLEYSIGSFLPANGELYSTLIPVQPNTTYKISYSVKTEELTSVGAQYPGSVIVSEYNSSAKESDALTANRVHDGKRDNVPTTTGTTNWTSKNYTFTTAANTVYVRIRLMNAGWGEAKGRVYFKDTELAPTPTPSPSYKPGDANGDTKVDGVDYVIWLNHYGQTISGGVAVGDFNKSGKIDGVDYVIWLNNFGK